MCIIILCLICVFLCAEYRKVPQWSCGRVLCCNVGGLVQEGISELVGHSGGFERPRGGEGGPSRRYREDIMISQVVLLDQYLTCVTLFVVATCSSYFYLLIYYFMHVKKLGSLCCL